MLYYHICVFLFAFSSALVLFLIDAQQPPQQQTEPPGDDIITQQHYSAGSTISTPYKVGDYYLKLALDEFNGVSNFLSHELLIRKSRTVLGTTTTSPSQPQNPNGNPPQPPPPPPIFGRICSSSNDVDSPSSLQDSLAIAGAMCRSIGFSRGVFWYRDFANPNYQQTTATQQQQDAFFAEHPIQFQNLTCSKDAGDLTQCSLLPITHPNEVSACTRTIALNCSYGFSRGYEFRLTPSWRIETRYFRSWAYYYNHGPPQPPRPLPPPSNNSSSAPPPAGPLPPLPPRDQRLNYFGRICDDSWNHVDTRALCRTMGFLLTENATYLSESIATSSIMYSRDDSNHIVLDNVQCAEYNYYPPYGNTFDMCNYATATHNCLSRYESVSVDCLGNKDIPRPPPFTFGPGGHTGHGGHGNGDDYGLGVKQESLLMFVCGTAFMLAAFFCCYKMMIKKRMERQAAIEAIRDGRIAAIDPTSGEHPGGGEMEMAMLEAMMLNSNRTRHNDDADGGGENDDPEDFLNVQRERRRRMLFENPLLLGFGLNNNNNNSNEEDENNTVILRRNLLRRRRGNNTTTAETFIMPGEEIGDENEITSTSTTRRNRALSLRQLSELLATSGSVVGHSTDGNSEHHHPILTRTRTPPTTTTTRAGSVRMINGRPYQAIPLIAEASVATPTVGVVTPRGGRSSSRRSRGGGLDDDAALHQQRPRSYSSPAAVVSSRRSETRGRNQDEQPSSSEKHSTTSDNNNITDDGSKESEDDEDENFVLPPRGYDSSASPSPSNNCSPSAVASRQQQAAAVVVDVVEPTFSTTAVTRNLLDDDDDDEGDHESHRNTRNHTSFALSVPNESRTDDDSSGDEDDVSGVDDLMLQQQQTSSTQTSPANRNQRNNNNNSPSNTDETTERSLDF